MLAFNGTHNRVKALSWLLLSQYPGLGYARIAALTGTSRGSLAVLLGRWLRWHYVMRGGTRGNYVYSLTDKSFVWINKHLDAMPLGSWLSSLPAANFPYFKTVYDIWEARTDKLRR